MGETVDAVILANTANEVFHALTLTTIATLREACSEITPRIVVVESNKAAAEKGWAYENCRTLVPEGQFNYNTFMLLGIAEGRSEHVLMCNNDLVFGRLSIDELVGAMRRHGLESASPYEPNWHTRYYGNSPPLLPVLGHDIENHVCGWCICAKRSMLERVEPLDERFSFWCQDSNYSMTLKSNAIQHGLIPSAFVRHEFSRSHDLLGHRHYEMTHGQKEIMIKKWGTT